MPSKKTFWQEALEYEHSRAERAIAQRDEAARMALIAEETIRELAKERDEAIRERDAARRLLGRHAGTAGHIQQMCDASVAALRAVAELTASAELAAAKLEAEALREKLDEARRLIANARFRLRNYNRGSIAREVCDALTEYRERVEGLDQYEDKREADDA